NYVIDTGRTIFQPSVLSAGGNGFENREEDAIERKKERVQWKNGVEFLMSCVAFSVGLGNVWRFPYTAYQNGGGAFLIPYIIVLFIIGKPFYYMEMILGQFTSSSCVQIWSVSPLFQGIGYGVVVSVFSVITYYCGLMALTLYYMVASCESVLPWTYCWEEWDDACFDSSSTVVGQVKNGSRSSADLYFRKVVLNETGIENGLGLPSWKLVLALLVSWIFVYVVICKGVKSTGKAAYFLALFPYVIMISLLVRAVTLDGAVDGIIFLFKPTWHKILEPAVCLMASMTIFGILGNLAHEIGSDDISSVVRAGTGLAFISYPEALAKFTVVPQLFAVLFFLMLFVLGIGTTVAFCNVIVSVIKDQFPQLNQWKIAAGVAIFGFSIGIVYCTPGGQYILNLVDYFGGTFIIVFLASFEVIAISWVYAAGWTLLALGLLPFPLGMILVGIQNKDKTWLNIIKPSANWGPKDPKQYNKWRDFKQSKKISRTCAKKSKVIATLFGNY
ncbi:sodium-dependent nutrient amino acid transporter 1-like protein, partial [Lasius niger]